jgi:hypothetical protein
VSLPRRTCAFVVDLAVLAAGLLVSAFFLARLTWLYALVGFVGYHTAFAWLTGSTPGKALLGLRIERLDGQRYERSIRRLPWLLGRTTIGYLVVDVLGLGLVLAALLPERRPAHDLVFRSVVTRVPEAGPEGLWPRVEDLERRLRASADEVRWPRRPVARLAAWIVGGLLALRSGIDMSFRWGGWLWRHLWPAAAAPSTSGFAAVPATTVPSVGATVGAVVATAAMTVALSVQVANRPWDDDDVVTAGGAAAPLVGVDLASLRSAPVPAMCDNPPGTMTDGQFSPPAGSGAGVAGVTALLQTALFADDGWTSTSVGDLTGDGVAEGVAVLYCSYSGGGNATDSQVVVYGPGPSILATVPFTEPTVARIREGAVDVVGLDIDEADPLCCPSIVEARSFRLDGNTVVEAERQPLDASQPITEGAWGSLRVGSSYADAALALGEPIDVDNDFGENVDLTPTTDACLSATSPGDLDISFLGSGDRTSILYVYDPRLRTDRGVGVGSSEQEVRAAYGAELFEAENIYQAVPDLYVGDPAMAEGPGLRFILDESTRRVGSLMVGQFPYVQAPEGCA